MSLFYRPEGAWVGDLIPYYEDGLFYAFYLRDPRNTSGTYAEDTTWYLATTRDFVNFTDRGIAIERGGEQELNRDIYTGSVIKGRDGQHYAFYTAYNPSFRMNGKSIQSVMMAAGNDLYSLSTLPGFCVKADDSVYEVHDWRDPFVFWNDEDECYWMLVAARLKGSGAHRGGCIGLCKSDDLISWRYAKPLYAPKMYITMECPEVFRMGEWWYLIFSTFSDRFVTHYRMAKTLDGPWIIPPDDALDTRANYAIKTASDGRRRFAFGWIASRKGERDSGSWEWGGTMAIHELSQDTLTGYLHVGPTPGLARYYRDGNDVNSWTLYNAVLSSNGQNAFYSDTLGAALCKVPQDSFSMQLEFIPEGGCEFGICLHTDEGLENGYFLRIDPVAGMLAWDQWPRREPGIYQWQIDGDVACRQETMRRFEKSPSYRMHIVREGSICVVYLNDKIALSTRMYDHKGGWGGPYIVQGRMRIDIWTISANPAQ